MDKVVFYFILFYLIYLFIYLRESMSKGGAEEEGEKES